MIAGRATHASRDRVAPAARSRDARPNLGFLLFQEGNRDLKPKSTVQQPNRLAIACARGARAAHAPRPAPPPRAAVARGLRLGFLVLPLGNHDLKAKSTRQNRGASRSRAPRGPPCRRRSEASLWFFGFAAGNLDFKPKSTGRNRISKNLARTRAAQAQRKFVHSGFFGENALSVRFKSGFSGGKPTIRELKAHG